MSKQIEHWVKTKSLLWVTLIIWAFFAFIIHLFGTSLNGSFPGAYYMAGQGAQLAFVILTFWFASRQNKIDEEFGFSEDD
jgi:putative solute:sodium symporter small subunit